MRSLISLLMPLGAILYRLNAALGCPQECLCLSPIQVLCNTKGVLRSIPKNFPRETQEITITQQNIRRIPSNAFSTLKHLRKLILDSNNISQVDPFAFRGLKDMEEISLQNNRQLSRLPGFSFASLTNITHLKLGHNRIKAIDGYAFAGTESIKTLLLNNNPIKIVNSSAFSGLKKVDFLFLPAGVRNLQADAFNGLESVGVLKLAYLDLSELLGHTFRGLKDVKKLSIENSDLATIREKAFHGMTEVNELSLLNNKIDRIEDFSIPPQSFVNSLMLSGNHILEIPYQEALRGISVNQISVVENHFPCTCRVLFILDSVLGSADDFMLRNKCISPFSLNGRPMRDMTSLGILQKCDPAKLTRKRTPKPSPSSTTAYPTERPVTVTTSDEEINIPHSIGNDRIKLLQENQISSQGHSVVDIQGVSFAASETSLSHVNFLTLALIHRLC